MQSKELGERRPWIWLVGGGRLLVSWLGGGLGGAAIGIALSLSYLSRRSGSNGMPLLEPDHMLLAAAMALLGSAGVGQLLIPAGVPRLRWALACGIANPLVLLVASQIGRPPLPPFQGHGAVITYRHVVVDGTTAYLVSNPSSGAYRIDLADLRNPRPLGKGFGLWGRDALNTGARDMQIVDGRGYVIAEDQGLAVLDLRDPARPALLGELRATGVDHNGELNNAHLSIERGRAALAGPGGLALLDLRDPANITAVARMPGRQRMVYWDVALVDGRIYAQTLDGLEIIEPDGTGGLRVRGTLALPKGQRLEVAGTRAYVLADTRLHVIDISDPSRPTEEGIFDDEYGFTDLAVEGAQVYLLASRGARLVIVDLRDPARPRTLSEHHASLGGAVSLTLRDGIAYLSAYDRSLTMLDLRRPEQPERLGACNIHTNALGWEECGPDPQR